MLNNHCGVNRGSANKLTNLQEQSKPSNNQINTIQSAPLNNGNNHDNISSDNSEIQSLNNTLSGGAAMDEKQKMLLLKIANNSIAAASAVASVADIDYGNVSVSPRIPRSSFPANFLAARTSHTLDAISSLHPPARARGTHSTEHEIPLKQLSAKQKFHPRFSPFFLFIIPFTLVRLSPQNSASSSLLSPPTSTRRRGSSVMFNEFVILHTPPTIPEPQNDKNALSVEKMTQTGDGIWQVSGIIYLLRCRG